MAQRMGSPDVSIVDKIRPFREPVRVWCCRRAACSGKPPRYTRCPGRRHFVARQTPGDVDADEGDSKSFCHGGFLVFGASHEHCLLLGREHGRTIPLSDIGPVRQFQWLASYVDGGGLPALRAAKLAPIALSGSRKNLIAV